MIRPLNMVDWKDLIEGKNVEEILDIIKSTYEEMARKFVPFTRVNSKKRLPFMSKDIKKMINNRERLFRVYHTTKRDIYFIKYREMRNKTNAAITKDKLSELEKNVIC